MNDIKRYDYLWPKSCYFIRDRLEDVREFRHNPEHLGRMFRQWLFDKFGKTIAWNDEDLGKLLNKGVHFLLDTLPKWNDIIRRYNVTGDEIGHVFGYQSMRSHRNNPDFLDKIVRLVDLLEAGRDKKPKNVKKPGIEETKILRIKHRWNKLHKINIEKKALRLQNYNKLDGSNKI